MYPGPPPGASATRTLDPRKGEWSSIFFMFIRTGPNPLERYRSTLRSAYTDLPRGLHGNLSRRVVADNGYVWVWPLTWPLSSLPPCSNKARTKLEHGTSGEAGLLICFMFIKSLSRAPNPTAHLFVTCLGIEWIDRRGSWGRGVEVRSGGPPSSLSSKSRRVVYF